VQIRVAGTGSAARNGVQYQAETADKALGRRAILKIAEALERIVRLVPGLAGYQDKENRRDRDAELRRRIVAEIDARRREVDDVERHLTDSGDLLSLPMVDRLLGKLHELGSSISYAPRGYRGLFDVYKVGESQLDELRGFDEAVKRDIDGLRGMAGRLHESRSDRRALKRTTDELGEIIDRLIAVWSKRQSLITHDVRARPETTSRPDAVSG
jgi:hypothetical protein